MLDDWQPDVRNEAFSLNGILPKVNRNVQLLKGWFDDTLPDFLNKHKEHVSFVHIDCDIYSSARRVLESLKDRIHTGTVICFDEYYNRHGWKKNEYLAFQEFISENEFEYEYIGFS